jgi:molecular chaperone GrpE (heat shock protein)
LHHASLALANGTSVVVDSVEAKLDLMASQLQHLQAENANQTQLLQHVQEENANLSTQVYNQAQQLQHLQAENANYFQLMQTNFQSQNQLLQLLLGKISAH